MSGGPLVSIIVPSFNQGRFIGETLDSILAQRYRPIEILVIDGASTDETLDVLRTYEANHPELRWISEPDGGPADAVNKGLALASGSIAGIQSSDDLYLPGAIDAAVNAFTAEPELGIVYGDATTIDEAGTPVFTSSHLPFTLNRLLCGSTFIFQSSAFFRPDLALRLGGWRAQYFVMDVDLWLRMAFKAPARKLPVVLSSFRRHGEQRDKETRAIWESTWQMIEDSDDLPHAKLRQRLAAKAGRRMMTQYYNPGRSRRWVAVQLWLAIATYPPAARAVAYPRLLVPVWLGERSRPNVPRTRRRRPRG